MEFDVVSWVVIPFLIFCARVVDVSLGTLRFIFLAKGYRKLAPLLGFVEVLVWLLAVREVMVNLRNIACFLAYGVGFATGNYVGMWIEEKLSIGTVVIRVILRNGHQKLLAFMRRNHFGYTLVDGEGTKQKVKILFSVMRRQDLGIMVKAISTYNPRAFYSVENIRAVSEGIFPMTERTVFSRLFRQHRKSK